MRITLLCFAWQMLARLSGWAADACASARLRLEALQARWEVDTHG